MIQLSINNIPLDVPEGTTILAASKKAGIRIPTLCFVEGLQAIGACRVCVVELEGRGTSSPRAPCRSARG